MKKLNNLPYGAAELKKQINSSTMKGFILSLMFFMVFGLAVSSLHNLVNDTKSPEITDIPITVVSNYELKKTVDISNNGTKGKLTNSTTEIIGKNQKFTEEVDIPKINASIFDVGINTDEILNNIGNALGLGSDVESGNGELLVGNKNLKNGNSEEAMDISKEFVQQDMQKFPSMDYDRIKSLVKYPQQAKSLNLSGSVHIAALIDKSGKLAKSYIYSSTNSLFDEEALQAVRNYNDFSPAINNGKTVDCWIIIPIKFKLK